MNTKQTTWHWPDHVIGKRESRRLREEHNALANSHAELFAALHEIAERPADVPGYNSASAILLRIVAIQSVAREALAKWREADCEQS